MKKYLSRKFLICLAAFLGSLGTSIAAFAANYPVVAIGGMICSTLSAAIYAACEAAVDAAAVDKGVEIVEVDAAAVDKGVEIEEVEE